MKYFLWRLLGKGFWMKLNSHYKDSIGELYAEWKQCREEILDYRVYRLIEEA